MNSFPELRFFRNLAPFLAEGTKILHTSLPVTDFNMIYVKSNTFYVAANELRNSNLFLVLGRTGVHTKGSSGTVSDMPNSNLQW